METELIYQLALSQVPHIGTVQARILATHFGNATHIFHAGKEALEKIEGIGEVRAGSISRFTDFAGAHKERDFIEKYHIQTLFLTDAHYPKRLLNCYDPPTLLFYKGMADLNSARIIAVVGTRDHSDYGRWVTEKLIKDLARLENVLVVSGLAFGVDATAHRAALKNRLQTVAVLGHGLKKIYPPEHASLAKEMVETGGLLTEFRSDTAARKHHFPIRNRVVAGMSDATIVVETGIKGGSMITAGLANGYHREVFAFPGKTTDSKSAGCNHLIKTNRAMLLGDARELMEAMGWEEKKKLPAARQKELRFELSADEEIVVGILRENGAAPVDRLHSKSNLSSSAVAAAILRLEMEGIIAALPGKVYKLM